MNIQTPYFIYMAEWLLQTKKVQQLKNENFITELFRDNLKPRFLIKMGYYIVPTPSTTLLKTLGWEINHFHYQHHREKVPQSEAPIKVLKLLGKIVIWSKKEGNNCPRNSLKISKDPYLP